MADPQAHEGRDDKSPPPGGSNGAGDEGPIDWQTRAAEAEKKLGQVLNENKRVKEARDKLSNELKKWNGLEDADPEELKALRQERRNADHEKARESGDLDKLIRDARSAAEKERDQERARREKAEALVQRKMIDDELNHFLDKYGVDPKYKRAVFSMLRGRFETVEDPEDEYGVRAVVKVDDAYMSGEEFIKNWAENDEEAVPFLKPSLATGGGAAGGSGARSRIKPRSKMTAREKSDLIQEIGKARYDQIPWE